MARDIPLTELIQQVIDAVDLMDAGRAEAAAKLAEEAIAALLEGRVGPDWLTLDASALLPLLAQPRRVQALARALWVVSSIDEDNGDYASAERRQRRAMELYGRLRMSIEELDIRAAKALGAASARLKRRSSEA